MAHWEYKPPVRQFFLSVACYVVKPEVQKFKRKKKCREQKETRCFQQKTADFVELLSRFELETSSLPLQKSCYSLLLSILPYCPQSIVLQRIEGNLYASCCFLSQLKKVYFLMPVSVFSGTQTS